MRIVFLGTPDFAVPSLNRLIESQHDVVGVVTQPDRPKGRGLNLMPTPVKRVALKNKLPVLQPDDLSSSVFIDALNQWNGECYVVVGFRILPRDVYDLPPKGTVNLHASLLPKYRGAAPIQWALIHGESETGVTTFYIQEKVDTGDLILQASCFIGEDETAGELHDRLAELGADLIVSTVDMISENCVETRPQEGEPSRAPKIKPQDCNVEWSESSVQISNRIRAFSPRPGAVTFIGEKRLKLFGVSIAENVTKKEEPGTILDTSEEGIRIQTGSGCIIVGEVQLEGKRRLPAGDFIRGYGSLKGLRLSSHQENK